jgi:hypothetical protein
MSAWNSDVRVQKWARLNGIVGLSQLFMTASDQTSRGSVFGKRRRMTASMVCRLRMN